MAVRQRRYSKEELARRGQELYESGIQQQVEVGNEGKIVAIASGSAELSRHRNRSLRGRRKCRARNQSPV
jgi:hypothetical protein